MIVSVVKEVNINITSIKKKTTNDSDCNSVFIVRYKEPFKLLGSFANATSLLMSNNMVKALNERKSCPCIAQFFFFKVFSFYHTQFIWM